MNHLSPGYSEYFLTVKFAWPFATQKKPAKTEGCTGYLPISRMPSMKPLADLVMCHESWSCCFCSMGGKKTHRFG